MPCQPVTHWRQRIRTQDGAVLAKAKTVSLTQPADVIPGSMKRPESRCKNDQQNTDTNHSQQHLLHRGIMGPNRTQFQILIVDR